MRLGICDPCNENYLNKEVFINHLKLVSINSGNERAIAAAIVDSSGNQITPIGIPSAVTSGRKAVTAAGTAERVVASSTPCKYVLVCAALGNTNPVAVGGSTVIAANGVTQQGTILIPGNDPVRIEMDDLNDLFVDAQTNGETVCFSYFV